MLEKRFDCDTRNSEEHLSGCFLHPQVLKGRQNGWDHPQGPSPLKEQFNLANNVALPFPAFQHLIAWRAVQLALFHFDLLRYSCHSRREYHNFL